MVNCQSICFSVYPYNVGATISNPRLSAYMASSTVETSAIRITWGYFDLTLDKIDLMCFRQVLCAAVASVAIISAPVSINVIDFFHGGCDKNRIALRILV